ncbi:MAG TPA: NUDIX hydrolase [Frankiaceae bacterium]|nr:NUDIX hydrolase [Frankiaceae bacterium]
MATDPRTRLPDEFAARVRALADGARPAQPKHASTVVLLRDVAEDEPGIEACLLRRVSTMAFAAGMHVFPGGSVDPADRAGPGDGSDWLGPSPDTWAGLLTADDGLARALICAAVRETFEESAVLLAGADEHDVADTSDPSWEADRQGLLDRAFSLSDLLARRQLRLRADLLRPWAHWVTPEVEPKRYDTRFFVAAMPAGQATRDVGGESDRMVWLRPQEALDLHEAGGLAMLPPTAFTLAELTAYSSVNSVLAAANERDIKPVLPRVVLTGEQAQLLLPTDEGYEHD